MKNTVPQRRLRLLYTSLFILLFFQGRSQTTLTAGDIAFTGINSNHNSTLANEFSFVILRTGGVSAGTTIRFTDNGWNTKITPAALGVSEGTIIWSANTALPQFTQVVIKVNTAGNAIQYVTAGTASNPANFILSAGGDQVFAYQGSPAAPVFIAGIHYNGNPGSTANLPTTEAGWDNLTGGTSPYPFTSNNSALPPGLTTGVNAVLAVGGTATPFTEFDNAKYNCTGATGATVADIRAAINNRTNWSLQDMTAFSLTGGCAFALGSSPVITAQPVSHNACQMDNISFSVTATNAAGYQWQVDHGNGYESMLDMIPAVTGVWTSVLTINGVPGDWSGAKFRVQVTASNGSSVFSDPATLTVGMPGLATSSGASANCVTAAVGSGSAFMDACNILSSVKPSGANPVSGAITSCTKIESSVPAYNGQPYVQRHYEINPATNGATATATITLYFLDAEFVAYNAARGSLPPLPTVATGGNTDPARANLRISQFHGSSNGAYMAGSYSGGATLITPGAAAVVYNGALQRWEVTFPVSGFSGFFVSTASSVLPVKIEAFDVERVGERNRLSWKLACTGTDAATIIVERSTDGLRFSSISQATIGGNECNREQTFTDPEKMNGIHYYRLKLVEPGGAVSFSAIRQAKPAAGNNGGLSAAIRSLGSTLTLEINAGRGGKALMIISDMQGRRLMRRSVQLQKGTQTIGQDIHHLAKGVYHLSLLAPGGKPLDLSFSKM